MRDAFAPARGLFKSTPENFAYPDPSLLEAVSSAGVAVASEAARQALEVYEVLGLLLGKAMYEGILVRARESESERERERLPIVCAHPRAFSLSPLTPLASRVLPPPSLPPARRRAR